MKLRVKESTFVQFAGELMEAGEGATYRPFATGNMSYSRAHSINDLRTAMLESISIMDQVTQLTQKDAERLQKMGRAFTEQDRIAGQKIGELEMR
ncbi:hypothetical protein MFLO_01040 [Listeria floridensis FSL S10-1187]|uniref:DUF3130 family protein n=1 Tax=Listeria floridensis FSL S10-1187 TaxID=1265817 RepID=A0ABN0RIR4_9LIST|nr:DUF3130 family protein [Listeria floridensis]EUJ33776.1 hypothetical protein MFLO_01040 [Listeria floridensis FSL S10-1187]